MKPYDTEQDKKEQVREMFDRIAPAYDRLNHTLSFQIDKLWRRRVVRIVRRSSPRRILDVATGTGDLAIALAARIPEAHVLGIDLSEQMLEEARRKVVRRGLDERVLLEEGNHLFHVGFCIEQTRYIGVAPKAGFARQWFKYRRIMRVLEGDRDRTGLHQRIAQLFGVSTGCIQF